MMKKLLALALTLILTLGLASPAMAVDKVTVEQLPEMPEGMTEEGEKLNIADESPEIQEYLREMYKQGMLTQDNSPYDLSYFDDYDYAPLRRSPSRVIANPHAAPRLACVKPAASVHPEPGSNSSLYNLLYL